MNNPSPAESSQSTSKLRIVGPQIPKGVVRVSGAKNAATRLMAAAMLTDEKVVLQNFPTELVDARHKARFIERIGGEVVFRKNEDLCEIACRDLDASGLEEFDFPIRTTYLLAAGQLVRGRTARIPYPGGCKLGERKYDLHIMVWERFGCQVTEHEGFIEMVRPVDGLVGCEIVFPISTVGGTENALLCAVVARGVTRVRNAYITPEITNLIELLRLMGAQVEVHGVSELVIQGVASLHGATCRIMADRIEALTWIVYAVLSEGDMVIEDVPFEAMEIPLIHLQESGIDFFRNRSSVYVSPKCFLHSSIQPFELSCGTHPGVISDMQPFFTLLALKASGKSLIVDYRYPERTAYLRELQKLAPGAIRWESSNTAMIRITGPVEFQPASVVSTDLRGSMALVMAALLAKGESTVENVSMALRGYNRLQEKLESLGIRLEE